MQGIRAGPLTHADGHHFDEAGFVGATEGGVGLDTAHDNDRVGVMGELVHPDLVAVGELAYPDGFHAGEDRTAAEFLRDAVALQNLALALVRGAAMAAHGRDDIGLRTLLLYELRQLPQNDRHVGNLPTAAGQHHPHPWLDPGTQLRIVQLLLQISRNILNAVPLENLPYLAHLREGRTGQYLPQAGLFFDFHGRHHPFIYSRSSCIRRASCMACLNSGNGFAPSVCSLICTKGFTRKPKNRPRSSNVSVSPPAFR